MDISELKYKLESRYGKAIRYSKDCESLSKSIEKTLNERISVSTLKRILGFANSSTFPRLHTLDILAKYIGYLDWSSLNAESDIRNQKGFQFQDHSIKIERENDALNVLRHHLISAISRHKIDKDQILVLCKKYGKNNYFINFTIELIDIAFRQKNILFLKDIFELPFIFNPKYHNPVDIYYLGQMIGICMRENMDMADELIPWFAASAHAQKYFIEWFVDEDHLIGYYGRLLDAYHRNKKKPIDSLVFYYTMKYMQSIQSGDIIQTQKWYFLASKLKITPNTIHPALAARYMGINIIEKGIQVRENHEMGNLFKKFTENVSYDSSICFYLYLMRLLFRSKKTEWIIFLAQTHEKKSQTLEKEYSHWGIKVDNELQIYLAYSQYLLGDINRAMIIFEGIDVNLFEPFIYNQLHLDYCGIASLLGKINSK